MRPNNQQQTMPIKTIEIVLFSFFPFVTRQHLANDVWITVDILVHRQNERIAVQVMTNQVKNIQVPVILHIAATKSLSRIKASNLFSILFYVHQAFIFHSLSHSLSVVAKIRYCPVSKPLELILISISKIPISFGSVAICIEKSNIMFKIFIEWKMPFGIAYK